MQALQMPIKPFQSISMDFITNLPPSKESYTGIVNDYLLIIVDRYIKIIRFIPYRKTINAPKLAQLFIKQWIKDQGLLAKIILDYGSIFISKFWSILCFYLKIYQGLSIAFYPQTDSQTKRINQTIKTWLRCYICYMQDNQTNLLLLAEFAYNNALYDLIRISPNKARYGLTLDIYQGIKDNPKKGKIKTIKENAIQILKKR